MNKSTIEDTRAMSEFKGISFSGYKTLDVVKCLITAMTGEKIEDACYWCSELICSGHYMELWECIFHYYCKYIHIANPKLSIYIATKLIRFRENMNNVDSQQEQLEFRNDNGFRTLFIELIVIMSLSPKKYTVTAVKVGENDFNMLKLKDLLQAPDLSYSEDIFKEDDPKELMITINEFSYNLSDTVSNTLKAYYWYEWVVEYIKICKKNKQVCRIHKRENEGIDEKYLTNPIWLVWEAIKKNADSRGSIYSKIINSLYTIFCVRYSDTHNTKRRLVVYFAISILTTNIIFSEYEILKDKTILTCVLNQIDKIFIQVKEKGAAIEKEKEKEKEGDTTEEKSSDKQNNNSGNKSIPFNVFEHDFIPRI